MQTQIRLIEIRQCSSWWKPVIHWLAWLTTFYGSSKRKLIRLRHIFAKSTSSLQIAWRCKQVEGFTQPSTGCC